MAKTKKLLLTALSVALVAIIAVFGTIAYLQDTDSDVNVMTLGEVDIVQHEYQRELNADGTYKTDTVDSQNSYVLEAFEQAKPLYPIVGDPSLSGTGYAGWDETTVRMSQVDSYGGMQVFAGKNAQDKFVTVENTGKSDAYVRTLVALEVGSGNSDLIGTSYHKTWTKKSIDTIEIDGNKYYLIEYVYAGAKNANGTFLRHENGILPAGDTTYPSLSQVYLKSVATNEDMKALDGNNNGTFDILVLSQAVQTEGFTDAKTALDTAFGTPEEKAAEWFGGEEIDFPVVVDTAEELTAAIANGGNIILAEDVVVNKQITIAKGKDVVLDLGGNTLAGAFNNQGASAVIYNQGDLTVKNGTVVSLAEYPDVNWGTEGFPTYATNTITNRAKLTIEDGAVIENRTNVGGASYAIDNQYGWAGTSTELIVNGGTIKAKDVAIRLCASTADYDNSVTINGGTIEGKRAVWIHLTGSDSAVAPKAALTVNGGNLTGTSNLAIYSYSYGNSFVATNVTISGGTFTGDVAFGGGYKGNQENVTITDGVFNGNLGRYVVDDGTNNGWENITF